jgi:hypothetical protein
MVEPPRSTTVALGPQQEAAAATVATTAATTTTPASPAPSDENGRTKSRYRPPIFPYLSHIRS